MKSSERDNRIIDSLKIKPVNHGQVYTFQIAVPPRLADQVTSEKIELLKQSLNEKGSNLIPLIIRNTNAYGEDELFEVVYGEDWVLAAKEIEAEKLWTWLFELDDNEAISIREELNEIVGVRKDVDPIIELTKAEFESLFNRKIRPLQELSKQNLEVLDQKNAELLSALEKISALEWKVDKILEILNPPLPSKINLKTAGDHEIIQALLDKKISETYGTAAAKAVQFWKQPDFSLTWENLKKSVKSGPHKISGFGKTTLSALQEVGYISSEK